MVVTVRYLESVRRCERTLQQVVIGIAGTAPRLSRVISPAVEFEKEWIAPAAGCTAGTTGYPRRSWRFGR